MVHDNESNNDNRKSVCWYNYESEEGNRQYIDYFWDAYQLRNKLCFRHLFSNYFKNKSEIKIAIVGGGNGWELRDIFYLLENEFKAISVSCTVIDPIEWPLGIIRNYLDGKYPVGFNQIRVGQANGELDPTELNKYDLVYFARCINFPDAKDLDFTWFKDKISCLSKTTLVAFDQVEQPVEKRFSYSFECNFLINFGDILKKCSVKDLSDKEALYIAGEERWQ